MIRRVHLPKPAFDKNCLEISGSLQMIRTGTGKSTNNCVCLFTCMITSVVDLEMPLNSDVYGTTSASTVSNGNWLVTESGGGFTQQYQTKEDSTLYCTPDRSPLWVDSELQWSPRLDKTSRSPDPGVR
ncbi:Bifunctional glutamine synthetase adenylyltransferase/adenylyl-removing enzyme [Trichinella pseudospiralis]